MDALCSCFISFGNHWQCVSTAPELERCCSSTDIAFEGLNFRHWALFILLSANVMLLSRVILLPTTGTGQYTLLAFRSRDAQSRDSTRLTVHCDRLTPYTYNQWIWSSSSLSSDCYIEIFPYLRPLPDQTIMFLPLPETSRITAPCHP